MTTTDPFTEAARAEADRQYPDNAIDSAHERGAEGVVIGAQWARTHLAAQEPSEDDAYEAHLERRRHRLSYVKPGMIRCSCGAPGYWGSAAGQEQHAMWHALRTGRAALAEGGEPL